MAVTYTPTTNFSAKDSLPSNDPSKVIKGSEFSVEFTAIQTAFSLAAPVASPTFTGTVTIPTADINGGHIAMLGILPDGTGIDWTQVVFKGLTIKGIYGREIFETWYKGTMMVQSGLPLEKIITHHYPYTEFQKGLEVMLTRSYGKVNHKQEQE